MKKTKSSLYGFDNESSVLDDLDHVQRIPCCLIDELPVIKEIPPKDLKDLAKDIQLYGQLTPVRVYPEEDGRFTLCSGLRRLRVIRDMLGWNTIRCIVEPFEKTHSYTKKTSARGEESPAVRSHVREVRCDVIDELPVIEAHPTEDLENLVKSIERYGQLTPVSVFQKKDGRFELCSGHLRLQAVRDILGRNTIRCIRVPYARDASSRLESKEETVARASLDQVQNIQCSLIDESPDNTGIPITNLDDLAQSIRQYGLLTPIGVYLKDDGRFELYSGHRRLRAVRDILKQESIRCIVEPYEKDAEKRFGKHLDANLQTRDKDVRFWIAEIGNALSIVQQREGGKGGKTEDMDLVSELFKEHGLTKGFSRASLYRIYQLKDMAPSLLDTYRYGVKAATLYHAITLTHEEQEELARRIEASMENISEDTEPGLEPAYSSAQFKRQVDQLKAEREKEVISRGRKKRTYAENLERLCAAYLKALMEAKTKEEKEIAHLIAADTQKEIEKMFKKEG